MATAPQHDDAPGSSQALWRKYRRTGDRAVRNRLVLAFAPLARAAAYRKLRELPPHAEVEDLVSCGLEAVVHAVDRYDPRRGTTLEQYVWTRVHGAILDELRRADWAPRSVRRWQRDVARATADFAGAHGRAPRPGELADALGVTPLELRRRQREIGRRAVVSLDATAVAAAEPERSPAGGRVDGVVDDDPAVDPLRAVAAEDARARLRDAIDTLPDREHRVAVLLYVERLTMAEAGRVLGVSESRVSQLHRSLTLHLLAELDEHRGLIVGSLAA